MKTSKTISRRNLLKGLALGAGAATLAACAPAGQAPAPAATEAPKPGADTQPTSAPAAPGGPVEIVYWGFSGGLGNTEDELVKMYNDKDTGVTVKREVQGNYEETAQKLTAQLAAKSALPEIVLLSDVWWFKFYRSGSLLPLNELIAAQKIDTSDFVESLWIEGVRKGVQHWIPFARSTPLFYYNADLLEQAGLEPRGPKTWAEFMEWAPKLVQKEGDTLKVAAFAHPGAASYIAWLFQCVAWQFGGSYSDADFNIKLLEPDTVRAAQFYQDTVNSMGWAIASKDVQKDFVTGLAATAMLSTGSLAGVLRDATFKVGTAFLPEEKQFGCCTGGAGLAILAGTAPDKAAAAIQYIDWATGNEGGAFWPQNTGYMPVRKSTAASESYAKFFEERPQARTAVEQLPKTKPQDAARVFIPGGDQIIGKGLERIVINKEDVTTVWTDVTRELDREAEPVKRDIAAMGG